MNTETAPQVEMVSELPEPEGWTFQHEDTGRMTTLENDGINNPENFVKNNNRFVLCGALYSEKQMRAYAQAALNARAGGDGWLPIESVPRDGTRVLLVCMGTSEFECRKLGYMAVDGFDASYQNGFGKFNSSHWPATHWQPLPTPPAALASQAVGVKDGR